MKFRTKTAILGSLCGLLIVSLVLGEVFSPQRRGDSSVRLLPGLKTESVAKIQLKDKSAQVTLVKQKDWILLEGGRELPASLSRIDNLLKETASLTRGSVITSKESDWTDLGVSAAEGKSLQLIGSRGEKLAELTIGKAGVGGRGNYLRVGDGKEVYQTGETLSSYTGTERRFWSKLTILPDGLKADAAVRISLQGKLALSDGKDVRQFGYSLIRSRDSQGKTVWAIEGEKDRKLDDQKVNGIVSALIECEANDFADAAAAPLAAPAAQAALSMGDGREFTFVVGNKADGSQFNAGLKSGSLSYLVPEWRIERIFLTRDSVGSPIH